MQATPGTRPIDPLDVKLPARRLVYAFCFFLGLVVVETSAAFCFFGFLAPSSVMASGGILRSGSCVATERSEMLAPRLRADREGSMS